MEIEKEKYFETIQVEKEVTYYVVDGEKFINKNDAIERERQIEIFDNMNEINLDGQCYRIFSIKTKEDLKLITKDIKNDNLSFIVISSSAIMNPNFENIDLKNLPCQVVFVFKEKDYNFNYEYKFIEIEKFKKLLDQKINEIEKIKSIL